MKITFFERIAAPEGTPGTSAEFAWDELVDIFSSPDVVRNKRDASCVVFGTSKGDLRGDRNMLSRSAAVLDFDGPKDNPGVELEDLNQELEKLEALGVSFLWHTTFSSPHASTGRYKARVIIPLAADVPAEEWPDVAASLERFFPLQDESVKNVERVFFLPSVPFGGEKDFFFDSYVGARLASPTDFAPPSNVDKPTTFERVKKTRTTAQAANQAVSQVTVRQIRSLAQKIGSRMSDNDARDARRLKALVKGESFAEPGERHAAAISLLGLIVSWVPDGSSESIADLFAPVLAIWNAEKQEREGEPIAMTREYLIEEADKFRERDAAEKQAKAEAKEEAERTKRLFMAGLDAKRSPSKVVEAGKKTVDVVPESGLYSAAELVLCREACGASNDEELKRRWIMCFPGGSRAFLHPWGYSDTFDASTAKCFFRNELARAGLDMTNDRGEQIGLDLACERYGTAAPNLVYSLTASRNEWNPKTRVYSKALCPSATDLDVRFDGAWDEWLTLLGGKQSEKLKDWLACVMRVGSPLAALYIDSTQGSGKGLLTKALCALWENGRELPFDVLTKAFQYVSSPVVVINEGLSTGATSEVFRRLIGEPGMRIGRKFEADGFLEGCMRVIVTANNPDVFNFSKEVLSLSDQIATAKRIFHVTGERIMVNGEQTSAATEFLSKLAGADGLSMAERARSLAGHIRWLTINRKVVSTKRFLIEGDEQDVVNNIVTVNYTGDRICQALVQYVANPPTYNGENASFARIDGGVLEVTARFVSWLWGEVHGDKVNVPSSITVGKTMKSLCSGKLPSERVSTKGRSEIVNFWRVDSAKLRHWCLKSEYMSMEALEEALAQSTGNAKVRKPALEKIRGEKTSLTK